MFYDPQWLNDRNVRAREEPLRTSVIDNGRLLQSATGEAQAAIPPQLIAALLAAKLPSNQLYQEDEMGQKRFTQARLEDMSRPFTRAQNWQGPEDEPDLNRFNSDPKWQKLYATSPATANTLFKERFGATYDELMKRKADQIKFITDTVQKRIAGNELRQTPQGEWEEMGEVKDDTSTSGTRKGWSPASWQTLDMLRKAGGPERLGLSNAKAMVAALASRDAKNKPGAPTVAPEISEGGGVPNRTVEGLLPFLGRQVKQSLTSDRVAHQQGLQMEADMGGQDALQMHSITPLLNRFKNLGPLLLGGAQRETNPDFASPTNWESEVVAVNNLRARQGKRPITEDEYVAWRTQQSMNRR